MLSQHGPYFTLELIHISVLLAAEGKQEGKQEGNSQHKYLLFRGVPLRSWKTRQGSTPLQNSPIYQHPTLYYNNVGINHAFTKPFWIKYALTVVASIFTVIA